MPGPIFRTTLITLLACGVAGGLLYSVQSRPRPTSAAEQNAPAAAPHAHARPHTRGPQLSETDPFRGMGPPPNLRTATTRPASTTTPGAPQPTDDLDLNDPTLLLPLARLALANVGVDDLADALWLRAINNPNLSAEDRQNLIEDLNEDGFPDPERLTPDDLPLIEARLALIARISPDAMDETNTAAFEEAHKDLLEMRSKLKPEPAHTEPPR